MITEFTSNIGITQTELLKLAALFALILVALLFFYFNLRRIRLKRVAFIAYPDTIMSVSESDKHMKHLAWQHKKVKHKRNSKIIGDLCRMVYFNLLSIRRSLSAAPSKVISLIPSARWLFDNYHMLYREIKNLQGVMEIRGRFLVLTEGKFKGCPRIYAVAHELIYCSGRHLSEAKIISMLKAYQSVTPLTSAELWSLPCMLGLCILENIVRNAQDIISIIKTKSHADEFVSSRTSNLPIGADIPKALSGGIDKVNLYDTVFLSHVIYCLKYMSVDEEQINKWISGLKLTNEAPLKTNDIINKEGYFEANLETVVRALIGSLREVNNLNSEELFESISPVENVLRQDPMDIYSKMDSESRGRYRHAVERLAKRLNLPEVLVAEKAISAASSPPKDLESSCPNHVGTYLIGKGAPFFESFVKNGGEAAIIKHRNNARGKLYFITIGIFAALGAALLAFMIYKAGYNVNGAGSIAFILASLPIVIGIAAECSNTIFTNAVKAERLPTLNFRDDVPESCTTYIVMPVIINSPEQAEQFALRMEKHYLANRQSNLYFAVLGDFKDAPERMMPQDEIILKAAEETVAALNEKYPAEHMRFSLFFRYRKWNEGEGCWMGWERKRGKLEEFNALLCGEKGTSISLITGDPSIFGSIKYVITLDSDTDITQNSAADFIGTMEHPLNRPVIDADKQCVKEGYVIIQSQIRNHFPHPASGLFSKIFSGQVGIDPYATVVSDVYQDTFNEGIYVGKGIYDVKMFHRLLNGIFPENSVLSHDLLESCYARCAFSGGIVMMDAFPSNLISYSKREHRWIRGDWQLLPWLFRRSRISVLSRWKIFDNLRRSLTPSFKILCILLNAFLLPQAVYLWLLVVFLSDALHAFLILLGTIKDKLMRPMGRIAVLSFIGTVWKIIEQAIFGIVLTPYRAYIATDAILRTLYRLAVSRKKLLQWVTFDIAESGLNKTLGSYASDMWVTAVPALLLVFAIAAFGGSPYGSAILGILALLWILTPFIAYLLNLPQHALGINKPDIEDRNMLRKLARRTWQYFIDFMTESNNWLCPDNYQTAPDAKASLRTSPTNIGLQLLSLLTARDLGYISLEELADYCENIMYTVAVLPRWEGHLYNWYDIRTLEVLPPQYVSTVDSGNFIAYLIAFKNGLDELRDKPVFTPAVIEGLRDTLYLSGCNIKMPDRFASAADFIGFLQDLSDELINAAPKPWEDIKFREALLKYTQSLMVDAEIYGSFDEGPDFKKTLKTLAEGKNLGAVEFIKRLNGLLKTIENIVDNTDFSQLFNKKRMLFHIGYFAGSQVMDEGHYDLVASEALLTSFVAIAKGDVPTKHWNKLGRPLTFIRGIPAFVSWSGSMFEYLMPGLVMKDYRGSSFYDSHNAAIIQQIRYAKRRKIPWGISESQYFCFDMDSNYQYKAFGVPRLRLQPTMQRSLVVAPYASMLALPYKLKKAIKNLKTLELLNADGEYGFYESLDFNTPDPQALRNYSVVKCFMTHHLGMSLVSINNAINQNIMQLRFHREPMMMAADSLLEEMGRGGIVTVARKGYTIDIKHMDFEDDRAESRIINSVCPEYPSANWLSNGLYSVMLTSDGDGFSRYNNDFLNRWRSDRYSFSGSYIYVRDVLAGKYWSTTYKPTRVKPDIYQAVFTNYKSEFIRQDGDILTRMEVALSPKDNVEIRKVTFQNLNVFETILEVTSYLEVVLDRFESELSHPVFNKLFLESEYIEDKEILLYKRRTKQDGKPVYLVQMIQTAPNLKRSVEFEIDRLRFLGRNRTPEQPEALLNKMPLSSKAGFSNDPIISLRTSIILESRQSVTISFITAVCSSRQEAIDLRKQFAESVRVEDVFEQFRLTCSLRLKYLNITNVMGNIFQDLIGPLFYPVRQMRGRVSSMERSSKDQSSLWRFGISGDNPILLLRVDSEEDTGAVKDVLKAYEFLRLNGVKVDLVILNEQKIGYYQDFNNLLIELTRTLKVYDENETKPSLFILQAWQLNEAELDLLYTVGRIVFSSSTGIYFRKLHEQIDNKTLINYPSITESSENEASETEPAAEEVRLNDTEFNNGFGGFFAGGREYKIVLNKWKQPPAPWINVIANDNFGFLVSETGGGYIWSQNSRENKTTPWSNDPVTNPVSEAVFIKNTDTDEVYSPQSLGIVTSGTYTVRHGFGYSVFEHTEDMLEQKLTVFVPLAQPVKIWNLNLFNGSERQTELELTLYADLVLGVDKESAGNYIVTSYDPFSQIFSAKNEYRFYFKKSRAFMFSSERIVGFTGDRREFIGTGGPWRKSPGLYTGLSGSVGAGLDPCFVVRVVIALSPGERRDVVFGLGQSDDNEEIEKICLKFKNAEYARRKLDEVKKYWNKLLGQTEVKTQDRALNILANGWLLYQTLSCRMLARTAFYQCGGAFGFRDQLQDSLAFLDCCPTIVRKQIMLHCSRQFEEGDVQHWWHANNGLGVRTRFSDDYLWLPYAVGQYIKNTGDYSLLDETIPYIKGPALEQGENEKLFIPNISDNSASVYEHCLNAINRVRFGEHKLPLIGGGDWNDGMNQVGLGGRGESVWLGWFLHSALNGFLPACRHKKDAANEKRLLDMGKALTENIEKYAWDGEWYLRAFFDDGQKLGSKENVECRIDSISQSWSALSGSKNTERAKTALSSAVRWLVRPEAGLSLLLAPPFDKTDKTPGYIRDYYPGFRENGGQYTHAAIWLAMGHMKLQDKPAAYRMLRMLNPILITASNREAVKYQKEPYVMTADIASAADYTGRGGWSWYTGSSGLMYQAIIMFLGIKKNGNQITIEPSAPPSFGDYSVRYRYKTSVYVIKVKYSPKPDGHASRLTVDGVGLDGNSFVLSDDGMEHEAVFTYH